MIELDLELTSAGSNVVAAMTLPRLCLYEPVDPATLVFRLELTLPVTEPRPTFSPS